jgi:hypothetical protein
MIIKLPIIEDNKIIFNLFKIEKKKEHLLLSLIDNKNEFKNNTINDNFNLLDSTNESSSSTQTSTQPQENSDNISLLKICGCNKTHGMNFMNIYFPLKLNIIDNKYLWFYYFFNVSLISDLENNIDFFSVLNNIIITKFNLKLMTISNLNTLFSKIWKNGASEHLLLSNNKNFNNLDQFNKNLWDIVNLNLNLAIFLIWMEPNYTNKNIKEYQQKHQIPKKIILLGNALKNIKFKINSSNEYTISEHFEYINNEPIKLNKLELGKSYFIKINEQKYFLTKLDYINNNIIKSNNFQFEYSKYLLYHYPPNLEITNNYITINFFYNNSIYNESINKYNSNIESIYHNKIIDYFINKPLKSNLIYFINKSNNNLETLSISKEKDKITSEKNKVFPNETTDFDILSSNSYDHNFFKYIVQKYNEIDKITQIIKILFNNYTFPIKFNKYEIEPIFDDILYISLYNLKKILTSTDNKIIIKNEINNIIPNKVRMLYYNITKLFLKLIENPNENISNYKFFHEMIYKNFIKIFFFENCNSYTLLKELINDHQVIEKIKTYIQNSFTLIDISNKINWSNIYTKLPYLKCLIKNKNLFFQDKINKIIIPDSYDNRIKNIIQNPYEMINNMKTLDEYILWFNFLDFKLIEFFNVQISLSSNDINELAKLIYLLYNVKEQDIKDNSYKIFLNHCNSNLKLILYNQRINLKIKEMLNIKITLNLGILAKHLNNFDNYDFCLDSNKDTNNNTNNNTCDLLTNNTGDLVTNNTGDLVTNNTRDLVTNTSDLVSTILADVNDISFLKNQLVIVTKKYIKYKSKYNNIKTEISTSYKK